MASKIPWLDCARRLTQGEHATTAYQPCWIYL